MSATALTNRRRLATLLSAWLLAGGGLAHAHPAPAPPRTAAPQAVTISAVGEFVALRKSLLGPEVSGRVEQVLVDVGDRVRKDQPLLELDRAIYRAELGRAHAQFALALARRDKAQLDFDRMAALWKDPGAQPPSVPRQRFDDARAALAIAEAQLAAAKAAVQLAERRLAQTTIRAPYDGVLTRRLVDPGQPVNAAPVTHVLEVASIDPIALEFSVPQKWLAHLRPSRPGAPGTRVRFEVLGVRPPRGEAPIERVFPALDPRTRSVRVRVLVPNPDHRLHPGMLASVRVTP